MTKASKTKQHYHHGDLKRALLECALLVIAEQGTSKLTLREIARRAGVSHAAPYRHFANKSELLGAVAAHAFRTLKEFLEAKLEDRTDKLEQFETLCLGYVQFAAQFPDHFQLMFESELPQKSDHLELREASRASYQILVDVVSECQALGLLRSGEAEELALTAWSMSHGLAVLFVDKQLVIRTPQELDDIVRMSARNLFIGLRSTRS